MFNALTTILTFALILVWLYTFFTKKKYIITLKGENLEEFLPYFYMLIILYSLLLIVISISLGIKVFFLLSKNDTKTLKLGYFAKFKNTRLGVKCKAIYIYIIGKVEKFFIFCQEMVIKINIFKKTYVLIFNYLGPGYNKYLVLFAKNCLNYSKKKNRNLIYFFVVFPRVIIILVLLVEIYFGTIHYYFYSLLLLIIPLIFRLILILLKDLGPRVLAELKEFVVTEVNNEPVFLETPEGSKKYGSITLRPAPSYPDLDFDGFMFDLYYPMLFITGHIESIIEPLVGSITKYILFFYYLIHVLGLWYIINNLPVT